MGKLVYEGEGHIDFSWPGTTRDNATVESFNGSLQSAVCSLQSATGMTEQGLVHVSGGCMVQNRGLAHTL